MKFRSILVTLALSLAAFTLNAFDGESIARITTKSGKTYNNCRIFKQDPDGVMFSHELGGAKILYSDMPDSIREKLGYDAAKAESYSNELKEKRKVEREQLFELRKEAIKAEAAASAAELKRLEVFGQAQSYGYETWQPWLGWTSFYPNNYQQGYSTKDLRDRSNYGSRTILSNINNCPPTYINRIVRRNNDGNGNISNRAVPFGVPALSNFVAPAIAPRASAVGGAKH